MFKQHLVNDLSLARPRACWVPELSVGVVTGRGEQLCLLASHLQFSWRLCLGAWPGPGFFLILTLCRQPAMGQPQPSFSPNMHLSTQLWAEREYPACLSYTRVNFLLLEWGIEPAFPMGFAAHAASDLLGSAMREPQDHGPALHERVAQRCRGG